MARKGPSARTTMAPAPPSPASPLDRLLLQLAADQGATKPVQDWARRLLQGDAAGGQAGTVGEMPAKEET
jgi:hypothetical protein